MIIYQSTKAGLSEDIADRTVLKKIEAESRRHSISFGKSEIRSWKDCTAAMNEVLNRTDVSDDANIYIEYNVPYTQFRADFCITGYKSDDKPVDMIIEMKGWDGEGIHTTENSSLIHSDFYQKDILHPSYQVWSYANYIRYFNSEVVEGQIEIDPSVYLYNLSASKKNDVIEDSRYDLCLSKAPVFYYEDFKKLAKRIDDLIKKPDYGKIIERIESGRLTVDSSLQKSLRRVLTEREFFAPMEDQVFIYDRILRGVRKAIETRQKKVFIVRGGPGTGKSVLALKLLSELVGGYDLKGKHTFTPAVYVTKTSAPRATYKKELLRLAKDVESLNPLFMGASAFAEKASNEFPVLIVDEAHRLTTRSSQYTPGKNQVMEIINAALVSVFLIDEHQNVSLADLGTVDEIKKWAKEMDATVEDGLSLKTQFRCSGSDHYLKWLDHVLMIPTQAPKPAGDLGYKVSVVDSIEELLETIKDRRSRGRSARMVAGYCWDWNTKDKKDRTETDFNLEGQSLRWNSTTDTWANDNNLEDEIGSIHSVQGMEFQVAGVIIGNDLLYRNGKVITDPEARSDKNGTMRGYKNDPVRADSVIRNTYYTLMSRGQEECVIYCVDRKLADYLRDQISLLST